MDIKVMPSKDIPKAAVKPMEQKPAKKKKIEEVVPEAEAEAPVEEEAAKAEVVEEDS